MKQVCCRHPRASRGIGAILEILIVAALILGGWYMYVSMNKGVAQTQKDLDKIGTVTPGQGLADATAPHSLPGQAIRRAEGMECQSNLRQLRMMIQTSTAEKGSPPVSITDIPDSIRIRTCPIGKCDYAYNSATGEIHCPYLGHEKY